MEKDILNALGQPLSSNLVHAIFKEFNIKERTKTFNYADGSQIEIKGWHNKQLDVTIGFEQTSDGQKLVNEITIEPNDGVLSVKFPFNLTLKDNAENIVKKLEKKPKSKSKSSLTSNDPELYQYGWWFEKENMKILTALNGNFCLLWLRVMSLSQSELKALELHKNLKLQKQNIITNPDFSMIQSAFPTIRWADSLNENNVFKKEKSDEFIEDFWFNDSIIKSMNLLIEHYLEKLKVACLKRNGLQIYNSVKWFVNKINKLNSSNDYFIETLERDELGTFIDKTINLTGFKLIKDVDITEQWREW